MGALQQDLPYAVRMLAKSPGFTMVAILTLALGIGANAAIFSLTDQVLLRLLPVQKPEELVVLHSPGPQHGRNWSDGDRGAAWSYPMYKDLRDHNEVFSGLLARFATQASVSGQGQTELANAELVTGNYFEVLGVRPALGRIFNPQDETTPGANPVVVLSYGYWQRRFGRDPGILNKQLVVNGISMTVVGVVRPGFFGVQVGQTPDVFVPMTMKAQMTPNWDGLADRQDHWLAILGRLKPGIRPAKAEAGLQPEYSAILQSESSAMKLSSQVKEGISGEENFVGPGVAWTSDPSARCGAAAVDSTIHGGISAANRLREPRQPFGGAWRSPAKRNRGKDGHGCGSLAVDKAASDGEFADFASGWSCGINRWVLDARRAG